MKKIFFVVTTPLVFAFCTNTTSKSDNTSDSTSSASMSEETKEERNKEVALAAQRFFENGNPNVDSIFKNADKNIIDYGTQEMPLAKGIDSTKAFVKMWLDAVPDYKGADFVAVADGDFVMVYGTWTGTWKNDLMGMKATGKSFKVKDVDIFKFNDEGKIIEHRAVQSMNEIARQIGMQMSEVPQH